jgi:hypothetical protein
MSRPAKSSRAATKTYPVCIFHYFTLGCVSIRVWRTAFVPALGFNWSGAHTNDDECKIANTLTDQC